jgi:hypothetical protein
MVIYLVPIETGGVRMFNVATQVSVLSEVKRRCHNIFSTSIETGGVRIEKQISLIFVQSGPMIQDRSTIQV